MPLIVTRHALWPAISRSSRPCVWQTDLSSRSQQCSSWRCWVLEKATQCTRLTLRRLNRSWSARSPFTCAWAVMMAFHTCYCFGSLLWWGMKSIKLLMLLILLTVRWLTQQLPPCRMISKDKLLYVPYLARIVNLTITTRYPGSNAH
jgi:hypothetical protein